MPVWKQFEKLVSNRFVYALGVADLDIAQLKALYEAAEKVRPMIDHYNTEHCCTVRFFLNLFICKGSNEKPVNLSQ